jgi:putative oxidoreductase
MRNTLFVVGRAVFGGFFVYSGINHFKNQEQMSGYAAMKGVVGPDVAVLGSGAMLLAGGLSVVLGYKPRLGLLMLIGFLIPTSLKMHGFWDVDDPQQKVSESVNFMKNMALVGAALTMMQLGDRWPASVESRAHGEQHGLGHVSYPRLSGTHLGALPA